MTFKHQIKHNDIVIAGSDGLFDNVDDKSIVKCVKPFLHQDDLPDVGLVAEMIAKLAYKLAFDP